MTHTPHAHKTPFKKGFLDYLKTGRFADVIVVSNDHLYPTHRLILAYSSEYFKRLLLSDFKESSQSTITLKLDDPRNVFPEMLAFMYDGKVKLTLENVIPLLALADHYLVEQLCVLCNNFLSANITRDTALTIIKRALEFSFDNIIERCITVIAKNFSKIEANYDFFPPPLFLELLLHPSLVVRNEYSLYLLVCHYIEVHPELQPQDIEKIMGTIRFIWMTYDDIAKVEANPLVPRALIIETCMERLKKYEAVPSLRPVLKGSTACEWYYNAMMEYENPRLRPRPPQSYIFVSFLFSLISLFFPFALQSQNSLTFLWNFRQILIQME